MSVSKRRIKGTQLLVPNPKILSEFKKIELGLMEKIVNPEELRKLKKVSVYVFEHCKITTTKKTFKNV